jgi:hypothetical protein
MSIPELSPDDKLIAYIASQHGDVTRTSLMKLTYLIDYVCRQKLGGTLSGFNWIRWWYGPFDRAVYESIDALLANGVFGSRVEFSPSGEYEVYEFVGGDNFEDSLDVTKKEVADKILQELHGHGPKMLTEVAYQTAPLVSIGAKIGNNNGVGTRLDLSIPPSAGTLTF